MSDPDRPTPERTPPDPTTLTPTQRDRRRRIVEAAVDLLEHGTFDSVQMKDVAAAADVALGTVYRYFGSKEHLFAAALLAWLQRLDRRVAGRPVPGSGAAERLDAMMGLVLTAFERVPQFYRLVMVVEAADDPHAQALYRTFGAQASTTFGGPLDGLTDDEAADVVAVTNAVLAASLRAWSVGSITMDDARARMRRCIELIFSSPPSPG